MRLSPRGRLTLLVPVCLPCLFICNGCFNPGLPPRGGPENVDPLPLRSDWARYADDNYRGVVMSQLRNVVGVQFPDAPTVVAGRNRRRGETELIATGFVDVPDVTGTTRVRRPYKIVWQRSGGFWSLADAHVNDTGEPVRPEPATGPAPTQ